MRRDQVTHGDDLYDTIQCYTFMSLIRCVLFLSFPFLHCPAFRPCCRASCCGPSCFYHNRVFVAVPSSCRCRVCSLLRRSFVQLLQELCRYTFSLFIPPFPVCLALGLQFCDTLTYRCVVDHLVGALEYALSPIRSESICLADSLDSDSLPESCSYLLDNVPQLRFHLLLCPQKSLP